MGGLVCLVCGAANLTRLYYLKRVAICLTCYQRLTTKG